MLSYDRAIQYYQTIMASGQIEVQKELFLRAATYAQIRSQWRISSPEQRREIEQQRTLAHNAFIDACNIMSRNMRKNNEDNSWRAELGDDRKVIGDFACYISLFLGIEAR